MDRDRWGWPKRASDRSFDVVGDRIIDAIRTLRRVTPPLRQSLYTVGDRTLTPVQVEALELLSTGDRWRMNEAAAKLGVDQSTVTRTLAPLVELGLLERAPDPLDGRSVVVRVSRAGRRRSASIAEARRELMREVVGPMAPEQREAFADLLEQYVRGHLEVRPNGS